jgi:hypothetical protein
VQAFVSLNWVLAEEPLDLETELALDFLDYLLVRTHTTACTCLDAPTCPRCRAVQRCTGTAPDAPPIRNRWARAQRRCARS